MNSTFPYHALGLRRCLLAPNLGRDLEDSWHRDEKLLYAGALQVKFLGGRVESAH